jgi:hypothetical protein
VKGNESCCSEPYNAKIICVVFSLDGSKVAIGLESGKIEVFMAECRIRNFSSYSGT